MVAMHTEGRAWVSWQEFTMTTKFRGKYIQILPLGESSAAASEFTIVNIMLMAN